MLEPHNDKGHYVFRVLFTHYLPKLLLLLLTSFLQRSIFMIQVMSRWSSVVERTGINYQRKCATSPANTLAAPADSVVVGGAAAPACYR